MARRTLLSRKSRELDDRGFDRASSHHATSQGRRRFKRRYAFGMFAGAAGVVLLILLPTIATSRAILIPLIDSYGGIAPLRVDFAHVSAGWFAPVGIEGLKIVDGEGRSVVKVGSVTTEKGLLSWMTSSQDLGTIRVRDVEIDVEVTAGSSDLEQALEPLLQPTDPTDPGKKNQLVGAIELNNARIAMRDAAHPDVWIVDIPTFSTQLPAANQIVGPTKLSATVRQAQTLSNELLAGTSGTDLAGASLVGSTIQGSVIPTVGGTIAAEVAESVAGDIRSFNVRAVMEQVPLGFWHIVRQRMPEMPIDDLGGTVSARIAGSIIDDQRWTLVAENFSGNQLVITAPSLVGVQPARLESVQLQGQAKLEGGLLALDNARLNMDVGTMTANGQFPWPVTLPTLTSPWLPGAQFNAEGSIDLAKLVVVAESLVPMRDNTRLISGSATFRAVQQITPNGQPSSLIHLQLGDLVALANGQQLTWNQPLKLDVTAQPQSDGQVGLTGSCTAEFCQIAATGSTNNGTIQGKVNLDTLQQRLSEWIDLPVSTMTGTADVDVRWSQGQPGLIAAEGKLRTTPVVIEMVSGGKLREPAWDGTFTAQARHRESQLASVERAHLELVAQSERLTVDLLEPLNLNALQTPVTQLVATTPGPASDRPLASSLAASPAAFTISSEGSLELWQNRAVMLKLIDPGMTLAGKYTLGASGRIDAQHLELLQANWRSQPFEVGMGASKLVEPEMVGNFQGRVDSGDLTRLAIEKLVVQAHSFSLSAADAASASGDGSRAGTGAFIADLSQLMRNMQTSEAAVSPTQLVLPPGVGTPPSVPTSQLALSGVVNGSIRWQVNNQSASMDLDAKTDQIDVLQQVAGKPPTRLWSEAQLSAAAKGAWDATTGNIQVESMQLQAPWMHYAGTMQIENQTNGQTMRAKGQCLYDASLVAVKLQPYIGNNLQMSGRKTVPVEVLLTTGGPVTSASTLAGLQAMTRIGWEQARVVGIDLGPADVPVSINAGQLASKTEIAVSGGMLRWDMQSDLTAPQTILVQKPMTVLENVAITPEMCQSWLKFVTPLLAEATSVDGRLSLQLNEARFNIANPADQFVDGTLVIHKATVGPGPLSNQVITLVQQVNAIRKKELATAVSSQHVWLQMPQQSIPFRMESGRVMHRDLKFNVGDVSLVSSGAVGIDGQMNLNTQMPIPDDWIDKSPLLAGMRGQTLQFPIRGSLSSPQLDAQFLKDFGRQAVTQAAEGLLQQQLQRGLGKLFGPMPIPGGASAAPVTPPGVSP